MIDRALFESYRDALGTSEELAEAALAQLLGSVPMGLSLDAVRDWLKREYPALAQRFGAIAAAVAIDFYGQARGSADVVEEYSPQMPEPVPASVLVDDVGYRMGPQYAAGRYDAESLARGLSSSLSRRVMGQADAAMLGAAHGDPAHPKWAIVPNPGACGYCVMLGSLGFSYNSDGTASVSRHSSCKCAVVADFDTGSPSLEGYDPGRLYRAYCDARETVEADVMRRWDAMSAAGKEAYRKRLESQWSSRGKRTLAQAEDHFMQRAIVGEMDRRDRGWLQDPDVSPKYEVIDGATPSAAEKDFANELARQGWKSFFRPVRDGGTDPKRTSDVFFRSGGEDGYVFTPVEFKQPTGSGKQTVFHQFEDGAGQANWLAIDARGLGGGLEDPDIERAAQRCVGRTYKVKKGARKGEPWGYDRVTVLMRDGTFRHYWS